MLEERCELVAEGDGVLSAEVDLIVRATEAEPYVSLAGPPSMSSCRRAVTGTDSSPPGRRGPRWLFDLFIIAPRDVLRHGGKL